MKSAIELAMEKVAEMPKIDAKEIEKHKQQELIETGESLANRLLNGALRKKNLTNELEKYDGAKRQLVRDSLLKVLKDTINLEDPSVNRLVFEILEVIDGQIDIETARVKLGQLIDDYQQQKQLDYALLVKDERNRLKLLGISGGAVIPNIHETEVWKEKLADLQERYSKKLKEIHNLLP